MSLLVPLVNTWGFQYQNEAGGSTTPGTLVTPGTSGSEGSWTQLVATGDITADIHYLVMQVCNGSINATQKDHLFDIGYSQDGGTTWREIISDVNAGASIVGGQGGRQFHFPARIPVGSAVAARIKGSASTANTVRVLLQLFGRPSRPELWRPYGSYESVGISGSAGTSFTPGNASWGSWTLLGTTGFENFWFQTGLGISTTTMNAEATRVQMAVGNGTNYVVINDLIVQTTSAEAIGSPLCAACTRYVKPGSSLYVRGFCSGAPASGYHASAHCVG